MRRELVLPLKVLYEDEYLAIIEKPAGIAVSGNSFKTIDNALVQSLNRSSLSDACRPRPVHRLDYPTTGLLLCGKTKSAIIQLNELFRNGLVDKTYLAISIGNIPSKGKTTELIDEKIAESHFKVLESTHSNRFKQLNLVELKPKTGRKHQLRKHLASISSPILGDKEYGKKGLILNGKGLYLHAFHLKFKHPLTLDSVEFHSEPPKRFCKIFPGKTLKFIN